MADGATALAVSSSTLIRFVPVADYNGTPPALTVRGLDNTYVAGFSSTAGSETRVNVNTTTNGGTTAIAATTANLSTSITAVNDAPVITIASLTLNEGQTVTLAPANFGITDPDDASFTYTVSDISGGYFQLSSAAGTPITTFTSADLAGNLVQFVDDGNEVAPAFSVTVNDGDVDSNTLAATITYDPVNDAPVLAAIEGAELGYTENAAATAITGTVTLSDVDSATLAFAWVRITGNYVNGEDVLSFTNTANITGSWDASAGTLLLIGSDTVANYQAALRAVKYSNSSDNPSTVARTASFTANDGAVNSNTVTRDITVTTVNDAPTATITPASYAATEQVALTLKNTGLSISDADAAAGSMTVTLSVTEGTLAVTAGGSGAVVSNSGTSSVTITGTMTQINNLLNIDATSTVSYTDGTDTPSASATLTLQVNDNGNTGGGSLSNSDTATITITAVNDVPSIVFGEGNKTYTENGQPMVIDGAVVVSDVDSTDFDTGTLTVDFIASGSNDDRLAIRHEGTDPGQIGVSGNSVSYGGTTIASFAGGDGINPLIITFNANATATSVQALTRNITFSNVSDTPDTTARLVRFLVTDGAGGGALVTKQINVTAVNDAPVAVDDTITATEDTLFTSTVSLIANDTDVDGPSKSAVAGTYTTTQGGTLVLAADGIYTCSPAANFTGTDTVNYTVTDGSLTDVGTLTITVTAVNDAPTTSAVTLTAMAEDGTRTITAAELLGNAADVENNTLTVSNLAISSGTLVDNGNDTWDFTPALNDDSSVSFTYTITDNGTTNGAADPKSVAGTATLDITPVNDAPVLAAIGNQTVNEGTTLTFTATATDADVPANTLTYSLSGAPTGATINATTGVFSWTPTEAQGPGSFSFDVIVSDGSGGTDSETITVTVSEVNVAPILAAIGNQTIAEGSPLTFTASATDADLPANTLTYSLSGTVPTGAAINATTGVFSWTPTEAQGPGSYSFDVIVSDGALTDVETITVTVSEVNVAPILAAIGNQTIAEGSPLTFTASATDADLPANTLTYSLSGTVPTGATINATTGVFSWTPTEAQGPGSYSFDVVVSDGAGGTDSETITVTVNEANIAPVLAVIGNQTIAEGSTLTFTAIATDADVPANTLTYSLDAASLAAGMTINASTGVFSWTPTESQDGIHAVTVTVTDNGTGTLSDSETITITVGDTNTAPVLAAIGNQSVNEGATLSFTATASDADLPSQTLTYSLDAASLALGMTINSSTGAFNWIPSEAQGGLTPSVTITVTDNGSGNLTDSETFTITVGDTNVAPVLAVIGNQSVNEGATLSFTATATDADLPGQTLTYSLDAASLALGMSINSSTGAFSWTPSEAQGGLTPSVTVTVTDNGTGLLTDSETFTITVGDTNLAPVLTAIGNQSVNEGATLSFTATATDADVPAQSLTYSLDVASIALGMSIDANSGIFSWTPSEAQGGLTPSVTITVTDNGSGNLTDSETFTVTVGDLNSAPVLAAIGNRSVNEGATLNFTATATDADVPAQSLTYSLDGASVALGMSIDANTGVFSWTPTEGQGGLTPSVTVTVTDNGTGALTDSETFTITVDDTNLAPVLAAIGNQSANEGATLTFTASATDADLPSQTLTYSLDVASLALGMTINSSTGVFSWTPSEAQGGLTPSVTVTVTDNGTGNLTDSETFTITVGDTNLAPVLAVIGNQSVAEGAALNFTATATDADLPIQTLSYTLDAASLALGMTINNSTGAFSWTPTEAQGGLTPSVTITVTDNGSGNLTDTETFTITVGDTNLAPVLAAIGNQSVNEGATLSFTATATDADVPANTLTYSLDGASLALGMSINSSTGAFSWTPTEAQGGLTPAVTITVTDNGSGLLTDSETFSITVGDTNVAPVLAAIGNQTVNEGATLTFTATASDADLPVQSLSYSLDAASLALGMTIDVNTGTFSWTPTEAQGGLTPSVTITVTDNGTGNLTDSETFTISVGDTNLAPVLAAIGNQSVAEGATLTFTAIATDPDLPSQTLTYSLDAASIALGMTIDANTGVFSWTPSEAPGRPDALGHRHGHRQRHGQPHR